ncbi:UdgX family uracil-DNA binding protein [Frigidibacter oleivorans]|uniref:UdgX family uracil-DNA binding protein n=1 Tax=Frigidibacter oleivorans TaxID=2487129 RepID=UPI000F8EDBD3|nr:UdgX family uracil-DNA binding protein [Frigidibacter oleivorans]
MREIVLPRVGSVAEWRRQVRGLLAAGVPPDRVIWRMGQAAPDLFAEAAPPDLATPDAGSAPPAPLRLGREAVAVLESAMHHSDPDRFALGHALVARLAAGRLVWGDRSDPPMRRLLAMDKAVRRDVHKMHAFVRFRELPADGPRRRFAAWFEPSQNSLEPAAPFFARRFGDMDWVIATPGLTARCVGGTLDIGETQAPPPRGIAADPGGRAPLPDRPPAPDAAEDLWRTYYASIFNPARPMPRAMQAEMPKKYWKNLPEAALIPGLLRQAEDRSRAMRKAQPRDPSPRIEAAMRNRRLPERDLPPDGAAPDLDTLARQIRTCTRCALHCHATQAVCGEGPHDAEMLIVGEQPGDQEDLQGRPFVGPAGQLFDRIAGEAGLDRRRVWVTNAVKHFKFTPRGKRRIHQRPDAGEVQACNWWLMQEVRLIRPRLIVAMGATAAQALTGDGRGILKRRGGLERPDGGAPVLVTLHPSALLRQPDPAAAAAQEAGFRDDLARAAGFVAAG